MTGGELGFKSFPVISNPNLESMNPSLNTPISNFPSLDLTQSPDVDKSLYSSEAGDFSQAVLKYINDILMEEDLQDKPCMLQDSLALQAAEKSLYDVLGQKNLHFDEKSAPTDIISDQVELESFPNSYSADFANLSNSAAENGRIYCRVEEEGRRKKQYSISTGESEQLEIFDNSFLHKVERNESLPCPLYDSSKNEESKKLQQNEHSQAPNSRIRRQTNKETMDLSTHLILCAQAAGNGDQKIAYEQLKLIRQNDSPFGHGNQRSAHYFANALEARLTGIKQEIGHPTNAAEVLKAYQLYVSICPFRQMSNFYTNRTIAKVVDKASSVHIIDFGISYGFQWPCFIYRLSTRPGGPPRIRITGIDFPQPGFRPAERVEETGRRLKRLADRLNVPFEYQAIAQKWESINYHDLNIGKEEIVAVCCMYRLKNLPDDTISVSKSSRDAVLELIKKINPNIFVHGVLNGSFNAPFFTTRFREAFFHFSAFFDMFEANATREDPQRLVFEREMIGKDVLNVIACEGIERFERPETYKQWQIRNLRMGFEQLQLHQDLMKRVRNIKNNYHKDFVVDEDGDWFLMGWRGRIIHAISAWKASQV
ncbi:hypothetical protein JCGZ_02977 [Jatropha curcas]|uniref:GRAS04 protein n=1 Tax=Jatropha curcas TaxID=180498 RepID=A0A067L1H5_JATCU|nr:scarecrow-like protein 9 [Jatropha curcas]AMR43751.1 GRAS04 protein [Jatropha curcas]KDP42247.1 hypothetical protein JCGZ_02977 [Jatropha curcas]